MTKSSSPLLVLKTFLDSPICFLLYVSILLTSSTILLLQVKLLLPIQLSMEVIAVSVLN